MATMINHASGIVRPTPPTAVFQEYPKAMTHPGYQPAQVAQEIRHPDGKISFVGGTSVRLAPVLVQDADQEEYYVSRGYVTTGTCDPAAFAKLAAQAQPVNAGYVPQEYPKWAGGVLVNSREEEDAALIARREQLKVKHPEPDPPPPASPVYHTPVVNVVEALRPQPFIPEVQDARDAVIKAMQDRMDHQANQLDSLMTLVQTLTQRHLDSITHVIGVGDALREPTDLPAEAVEQSVKRLTPPEPVLEATEKPKSRQRLAWERKQAKLAAEKGAAE